MALSPQLQAAKAFLTGPMDYTFQGETKPLAEWFAADNACISAMNDSSFGSGLRKTVARARLDGNDLVDAIGASDEFSSMQPATLAQLTFLVSRASFMITPNIVRALDQALQPFDSAKTAFDALKTRPATVWESIVRLDGAVFTQTEMNALRAG